VCEGAEDSVSCEVDCPLPVCSDNTCDPGEDSCSCAADSACSCLPVGSSCSASGDCCSNKCKGKAGAKVCK
jgi:hypothetical protein